ncbi:hypothetical protein [Ferrimonas balearica]|uniref:hypothetical protein n=1 Tax=Ferrimonas balearica TaxID=44012 RepID=UPI001C995827|nr:hypothetical protein [Ferrimonas balearica]MBY5991411.1 hypothetical protein [Ferrimonas balearica]
MRPVGIGLPAPTDNVRTPVAPGREPKPLEATAEAVLVQPGDAAGWASWQSGRARLYQEGGDHPALALYKDVANDDLRQNLQRLVGVDLYV